MPNIELYGFDSEKAEEIVDSFFRAITEPLRDDVVITEFYDTSCLCYDKEGLSMPFIRVYSTDKKEIETIVKILQPLGCDIETLQLSGFYPGKA